jgi:hypothetical protein
VGVAQVLVLLHYWPSPAAAGTALRLIEGALVAVEGGQVSALAAGAGVPYGQEVVCPLGGSAVVELADGSRVELKERSRLSVGRDRRGTTIDLEGGNIIVEAAPQVDGKLFVATGDCTVAVTGTVFAVNHGTRGSRVSVYEGEVRVDQAGRRQRVLQPGEQATTHASVARVSLAEEVAWSPRAEEHLALLRAVTALNEELRTLPRPGLRHDPALLSRLPAETVFYAALPNLAETLQEGLELVRARFAGSEVLAGIWAEAELESLAVTLERLAGIGLDLGEEVVLVGWTNNAGELGGAAALAETAAPARLRARLEEEVAELAARFPGEAVIHRVEDPFASEPGGGEGLVVWLGGDLLAVAADASALRRVAEVARGEAPSLAGGFADAIRARYDDGVETLLAVDLARLLGDAGVRNGAHRQLLGVDEVEHLLIEQWVVDQRAHRQAVLSFREARTGIASWLAPPGPMGSLSFVSPDASAAAAVVVKEPRMLLADVLAALGTDEREEALEKLARFEAEHGWSLGEDLFGPLGGEVAFALDGPVAPTPAWKLVLEVYDSARLQLGLERLVADLDRQLRAEGAGQLALSSERRGATTFHRVTRTGGVGPREVSYAYAHGYLVAAPSTALLDRALRVRESGHGLLASPKLRALLPPDAEVNLSALWYHDMASLAGPLARLFSTAVEGFAGDAAFSEEERTAFDELGRSLGAGAAWAYGEERQIRLSSTSANNPLGVLNLLMLRGLASK